MIRRLTSMKMAWKSIRNQAYLASRHRVGELDGCAKLFFSMLQNQTRPGTSPRFDTLTPSVAMSRDD